MHFYIKILLIYFDVKFILLFVLNQVLLKRLVFDDKLNNNNEWFKVIGDCIDT